MIMKKRVKDATQNEIIREIRKVRAQIENANLKFENQSDSDMIESVVYEIKSLNARYSYLLKLAARSDMNISSD